MYKSQVILDDGTAGEVNSQSPDRWNEGDEVIVTKQRANQHGTTLSLDKAEYANGQTGDGAPRQAARGREVGAQWALNAAIQMLTVKASKQLTVKEVEETARELTDARDRIIAPQATTPQTKEENAPF